MPRLVTIVLAACLAIGIGMSWTVVMCGMDGQTAKSCCCTAKNGLSKDCCCPHKTVKKQQTQVSDIAKAPVSLPAAAMVGRIYTLPISTNAQIDRVSAIHFATGPPIFIRHCSYLI